MDEAERAIDRLLAELGLDVPDTGEVPDDGRLPLWDEDDWGDW